MAGKDASFRQNAVREFLVKEELPATDIHARLQSEQGDVCMGGNIVRRWVKHRKDGSTITADGSSDSRPQNCLNLQKQIDFPIYTLKESALNSTARLIQGPPANRAIFEC